MVCWEVLSQQLGFWSLSLPLCKEEVVSRPEGGFKDGEKMRQG